jgi:lipopolysaccharide export system protein LptA|tara:strand:- start:595 stop:1101 length:507 start_codon:yes stop_codon:yes gene_type:complete
MAIKESLKDEKTEIDDGQDEVKKGINKINKIFYNTKDLNGNQYIVKSEFGEFNVNNPDIILMTNVESIIILKNSELVEIFSEKALYDSLNYNTNFYGGVLVKYGEHNITSDNFDLFFDKKIGTLFGGVIYKNLNTTLNADKIDLDLITKNSKIYMLSKSKKVKIKNLN